MKERIKELREKLGFNKTEFGKKILIKQSSLSNIESGKFNPSEQTIALICDRFNVNEEWLRTGEGEMFKPISTRTIDERLSKIGLQQLHLFEKIMALREEEIEMLKDYIEYLKTL
jgi:transcriptional regulator with XRE-family HTH domain